jgi:hypothetical protein
MSGVLNLALEGLQRLRTNHQLTGTAPLKDRKADYLLRSDPAHYFFITYLSQDSHAMPIEKGMMFDIFTKWCHARDKTPISDQWFARKLKRLVPYAGEQRPRDGDRKRSWTGIDLDWEAIDKETSIKLDGPGGPGGPCIAAIAADHTRIEEAIEKKGGPGGPGGPDKKCAKGAEKRKSEALEAKFGKG